MMRPPFRAAWLGAACCTALLAGCGSDSSGPNPGGHPAAMLLDGAVDPQQYGDEQSSLYFAVVAAGFPLDTTSAADSASIAALVAGKDILFLPQDNIPNDAAAGLAIKAFVDGGGTVVLAGGSSHLSWVNTAFSLTLASNSGYSDRHPMPKSDGADDTPFADGPGTLLANDDVSLIDPASLPGSAKVAYIGPDDDLDGSVAVIPSGAGRLVWLGWNFYDAAPIGLQDGGWRKLLSLTAGF
jgi:hypothetical protein